MDRLPLDDDGHRAPRARHEPALTKDPRVLLALVVVLGGFLGGLALLLFLIATDV